MGFLLVGHGAQGRMDHSWIGLFGLTKSRQFAGFREVAEAF